MSHRNERGERGERGAEIRRLRRMLKELAELAQHATVTGVLAGGAVAAVRRYNAVIDRLEKLGIPTDGFTPLPARASYDEVGVESSALAGYLRDEEDADYGGCGGKGRDMGMIVGLAPFIEQSALVDLLNANLAPGEQLEPGLVIALAPFLPRDEISRIVRDHMRNLRRPADEESEPDALSQPPPPPSPDVSPADRSMVMYDADPLSRRGAEPGLAELTAQLEALTGRLRRDDLAEQERDRLLTEISRIAARCTEIRRSLAPRGH